MTLFFRLQEGKGGGCQAIGLVLELTRLKSLDSVLWSLRRLTGDFALSGRGDDEA